MGVFDSGRDGVTFDYTAFKAEFKRKKRLGRTWWYGRFWAQDVVDELGRSAAEFTTMPWSARHLEMSAYEDETWDTWSDPGERALTRRLLRSAGRDVFIQELLHEVFSELAADAAMRNSELDALRAVRDEWIEMLVVPAAV